MLYDFSVSWRSLSQLGTHYLYFTRYQALKQLGCHTYLVFEHWKVCSVLIGFLFQFATYLCGGRCTPSFLLYTNLTNFQIFHVLAHEVKNLQWISDLSEFASILWFSIWPIQFQLQSPLDPIRHMYLVSSLKLYKDQTVLHAQTYPLL